MESVTSSSSVSAHKEAYNYDEFFMKQSLLFSDSLKDLKNLRKQLYSAAEYFELSYSRDDQQLVMDALKDYTIKALINTVDHLGSMAYKVNSLLDEKAGKFAGIELQVSCIGQRVRTCQEFNDYAGFSQQSLELKTPKHHKRYIFPAVDARYAVVPTESKFHSYSPCEVNDSHQLMNVRATSSKTPSPIVRNGHSVSPFSQSSSSPRAFMFTRIASNKEPGKQRESPNHFPLVRCGSLVTRSPAPEFPLTRTGSFVNRSYTPNPVHSKRHNPLEHRRAISLGPRAEKERTKEIEQYSSKSKRLLKALLSMRKPKKDGTLYLYLDE
ncbi:hypothetical protein L1049_022136 [Liquidambar formosana]|uniref:Protein ABIL2-like n=1 Tax=Liquidambar formosana TaxID=63359 RepID=A0AAP0WNI1_LIQFO